MAYSFIHRSYVQGVRARAFRLAVAVLPSLAVLLATGLVAGGCSDSGEVHAVRRASAEPVAKPNVLEVDAEDFYFRTRQNVPAGMTTIRLNAVGSELHHVQVVKLGAGHDLSDLVSQLGKREPLPEWITLVGGPNAPVPGGGVSEATVNLEPGDYALICLIPSADGVPHVMKGMMVPLSVIAADGPTSAPVADVRMVLRDYAFDITPALIHGPHTIRVENAATQPHEVFIARLEPGKTPADMLSWIVSRQGPPPAMPVGGATFIAPGGVNYLTVDLQPGEYGLFCFVPDAGDGKEHVAHGMIRQITVR
jgi:hypothetical protein